MLIMSAPLRQLLIVQARRRATEMRDKMAAGNMQTPIAGRVELPARRHSSHVRRAQHRPHLPPQRQSGGEVGWDHNKSAQSLLPQRCRLQQ